jgi:hypothetical protein
MPLHAKRPGIRHWIAASAGALALAGPCRAGSDAATIDALFGPPIAVPRGATSSETLAPAP